MFQDDTVDYLLLAQGNQDEDLLELWDCKIKTFEGRDFPMATPVDAGEVKIVQRAGNIVLAGGGESIELTQGLGLNRSDRGLRRVS